MRNRYRIRFTVTGRIRFLSHLEIVDVWVATLRRAGTTFAMSQGMKPKPLIKLALPRPVAVEGWSEIVEFESAEPIDVDDTALRLTGTMPSGLDLISIEPMADEEKAAASRVAGAVYRIELEGIDHDHLAQTCAEFAKLETFPIERRTPKQHRDVDVRAYVDEIVPLAPTPTTIGDVHDTVAIRCFAALTETGSVKPDEVVRALTTLASRPIRARRIIRESIALAHGHLPSTEQVTSQLALVGADVPDGPAKPWGSC